MSAWYVGNKSLSMITDIIYRYHFTGYNSFGFDIPDKLMNAFDSFNENDIFSKLREMNVEALKQRYDDYEEMIDDLPYEDGHDIWQPRNGIQPWHFQLLKSLQCYKYQCCEGDVPESDLWKGIQAFVNTLQGFIVSNLPEYEKAEWR